jgi:hypothetical protein
VAGDAIGSMGDPMRAVIAAVVVASVLVPVRNVAAEPGTPQLDLTLYGGAVIPSAGNERIDSLGPALGVSGFLRLGSLLGVGLVLEHQQLGWDAEGPAAVEPGTVEPGSAFPDSDGSISHDLALLAARLYFLKAGPADLFAQLGVGYSAVTYAPEHPDCSVSDDVGAQLALGAEWRLASALGLHTSLAASPFGWGMGCDDIGYEGKAPDSPWPKLGLSARVGLTTAWVSP